jgi:hypothetical protein
MTAQQGEVLGSETRVEQGAQVTYIKVDRGGGDVEEIQHLDSPGDDSLPLPGDFAASVELGKSGSRHATGYHDPKTEKKSGEGERRLYARDSSGNVVAEVWLKSDGTVHVEVLKAGATVEIINDGGAVRIQSRDINLGPTGGRRVACEGDIVIGAVRGICGAPGSPLIPVPPATPTATGGVPFAAQIVSGRNAVKASG